MVFSDGFSRLMRLQDLLYPLAQLQRSMGSLAELAELTTAADVPDVLSHLARFDMPDLVGQLTRVEVPDVVGQLTQIEVPDVVGQLTRIEVPDVLEQLTRIEVPDVLEQLARVEVPDVLGQLARVEVPDVVGQLTRIEVPDVLGQLTRIEVPDVLSQLTRIEVPDVLGQLTRIEVPHISEIVRIDLPMATDLMATALRNLEAPADVVRRTLEASASVSLKVNGYLDSMVSTFGETLRAWEEWGRQLPLMAAADAREAALRGDKRSVKAFVRDWLDRSPTADVVEAVEEALLEDEWLGVDPQLVAEFLRSRTRLYLRRLRPLGVTELRGKHIDSLDRLVFVGASEKPLHEFIAGPDPIQQLIKRMDLTEKMKWVKVCFTSTELRMLWRYSRGFGWAKAAVIEGFPPESGEALRRKVRRLCKGS